MVLDKNKAYKNLKKKGFVDSDTHSNDHKYLEFYYKGKLVLYTKLSHGSKSDLNDYLIKQMSNQCKISKNDFAEMVNCTFSAKDYEEALKSLGVIF